jgi:N-acetylglucosamine-6-phosphate deacetylase
MPGAIELIGWLRSLSIVVSLGHTDATFEDALAGIEAGAELSTHSFNAQSPLNQRNPGVIAALAEDYRCFMELIGDGLHVVPAMIQFLIQTIGFGRAIIVTDSLECAGMGDGTKGELGGLSFEVKGGVARLENGTIAGSTASMLDCFHVLRNMGYTLEQIAHLTSFNASRLLGQTNHHDLVVLDHRDKVVLTIIDGELFDNNA